MKINIKLIKYISTLHILIGKRLLNCNGRYDGVIERKDLENMIVYQRITKDFELNSSVFEVYSMNKTHVNFTAVIYPNSTIVSDSADNLSGIISNNRCYWYLECY